MYHAESKVLPVTSSAKVHVEKLAVAACHTSLRVVADGWLQGKLT